MNKFNIYKTRNANSHGSMNDYKSIIAAEIFWTMCGKQGGLSEFRAVIPNSKHETYEALNGDLVGAIKLDENSITEWTSTHKEIIAAIDAIQDAHEDAYFRCKDAIDTINKHREALLGHDNFYDKVDDYEIPTRQPWVPMEMDYRSLLNTRYTAHLNQ